MGSELDFLSEIQVSIVGLVCVFYNVVPTVSVMHEIVHTTSNYHAIYIPLSFRFPH